MSSLMLINKGIRFIYAKGTLFAMDLGERLYFYQQKQTEGTVSPDSSSPRPLSCLLTLPFPLTSFTACKLCSTAEMIA